MKQLIAETQPLNTLSLQAANDSVVNPVIVTSSIMNTPAVREIAQSKSASAARAWDPHEVWRTRILPYQRQQRFRCLADLDRRGPQ